MTGKVNSIQSLGTLDGPGVRFVLFMQGCNLRCGCCHNPDTWHSSGGDIYSAEEIYNKVERYKDYFGADGGITASGGEPLLQAQFLYELFSLCKAGKINTCLDTSGSFVNDGVHKLLSVTDRVLLDVKYHTNELYRKYVGCGYGDVISFLNMLSEKGIPTTLRRVIIPSLNDTDESINELRELAARYSCVDKIELLPFKKICAVKYERLNLPFAFENFREPTREEMDTLSAKLL